MTLPPIPESTLRATYTREQPHRHDWPQLYEDGMRDPIIARIVDMLARRQVPSFGRRRADRQGVKLRAVDAPCTCIDVCRIGQISTPGGGKCQGLRGGYTKGLAPGEVDRKRAASGDDTDK